MVCVTAREARQERAMKGERMGEEGRGFGKREDRRGRRERPWNYCEVTVPVELSGRKFPLPT